MASTIWIITDSLVRLWNGCARILQDQNTIDIAAQLLLPQVATT